VSGSNDNDRAACNGAELAVAAGWMNVKYTNQLADANGNFSVEASDCRQIWFEHVANLQQEWL
jgi:hypothetical protein